MIIMIYVLHVSLLSAQRSMLLNVLIAMVSTVRVPWFDRFAPGKGHLPTSLYGRIPRRRKLHGTAIMAELKI